MKNYCASVVTWNWAELFPKIPVSSRTLPSLTLKTETVCFSETLVSTYGFKLCHKCRRTTSTSSHRLKNQIFHLCLWVLCSLFNDAFSESKNIKLSRYTPCRSQEGEEVLLLLILDLGPRWGWEVCVTPEPRFIPGKESPVAIG